MITEDTQHDLPNTTPCLKKRATFNQKTLYRATSINLCFCTTVPDKAENAKIVFFPQCCISALPEFNQLLDFFNLFDSRLILTLLYDSLSLVINAFSYREYWGMVQEKGSR